MKLEELYRLSWELSVNIQAMQVQLNKTNQQIFEIRNTKTQQPVIEKKDNSEIIKDPKKEEKKKELMH